MQETETKDDLPTAGQSYNNNENMWSAYPAAQSAEQA